MHGTREEQKSSDKDGVFSVVSKIIFGMLYRPPLHHNVITQKKDIAMSNLHERRSTYQNVGLIGLGRMGREIGPTLQRAGFNVKATSRSAASRSSINNGAINIVDSPAKVTANSDVILITVFDTQALIEVVEGDNGVLSTMKPGNIVIDLGTSDIQETINLSKKVEGAGGRYIDAPVSGGTRGAATGQLTIMAGGSPDALTNARPILDALGRVNHMGEVGAGQSTKAINQLILGQALVAVAEGLALADRLGLDQGQVRDALLGGFAESRVLKEHGLRIVDKNFVPGGSISVFSKDLKLVSDHINSLDLILPGLENANNLYNFALSEGMGDLDQSALYKLYARRTLPARKADWELLG